MALIVPLFVGGGVSTEAGPSFAGAPSAEGGLEVPWLIECQNAVFQRDGWPRKAPGAAKVNAVPTGASDAVNGVFDYWRSGSGGSPTQQRMVYSGTALYREVSGTLVSVLTGLAAGAVPGFEVANDDLIFSTSSLLDVPKRYDQTTAGNLGGSPPNFSVCKVHKGRVFAFGPTVPNRLYYTVFENHQDWTGVGSGAIDVGASGSELRAMESHKDELVLFQGGGRPAIFRLTGSSPTGSDAFGLLPFVTGVGATNQASLIHIRDDLVFVDDAGFHSLAATAAYGDYNVSSVSDAIATWFNEQVNHTRLPYMSGVNFAAKGYALWTLASAASTTNDLILLWDYRFSPPRWVFWPMAACASLGMVKDANLSPTPWAGTYTGHVLRLNQASKNWAGAAYSYRVLFPYLSFTDAWLDKGVRSARVGYRPVGESAFTLGWQRDDHTQQTVTIDQSGASDTLAPSSSQFILDTSTLGGGRYRHAFVDLSGQFKELQLELSQATVDVDFEPHGLALEIEGAGRGAVEIPG